MVKQSVHLSAVQLNLPDAGGETVCMANFHCQQSPFTIHWDQFNLDDLVQEFHAVIGQDRELIHIGDFVKLSSTHYEEVQSLSLI